MLVGGILGYVFREKVETTLRNSMYGSIRLYGNNKAVTDAWDETQSRLHCCGVNNYLDWKDFLPDSCCQEPVPGKKQRCLPGYSTLYQNGCLNITTEFVKDHAKIIGAAGIIVACLMVCMVY